MHAKFQYANLDGRDHLGDLDIDERKILQNMGVTGHLGDLGILWRKLLKRMLINRIQG
jgi:hypothetical protein